MKMGKAMIGGLGLAAALAGGLGADMRHLDTAAVRIERQNSKKRGLHDPRDPKRKKTTRAWRKKVRRDYPQKMKDRRHFNEAYRANPVNRMTGWQLHQWERACARAEQRVDPAPFTRLVRPR